MYNINYQFLTLNDGYIYRCGKELFTSEILRRFLHNKFHHNYWVCILDSLSPLELLLRLCFRHRSTSFRITAIQLVLFPLARLSF